ncbi:MAG: glycosyl transferase family 4 [Candidatus Aenigmatarchaeota archaeon]|nr:MAG: glycosyl transferase family 4 [Candidatus Aenigmarchaeota archaeon]
MVDAVIFICFVASFLTTLALMPKWLRKTEIIGLVGKDMNKPKKPDVPEAGGVTVIAGAAIGVLVYIFLFTFYFRSEFSLIEIMATLTTILLAGFIGFIDDIIGWKSGISQKTKVFLTIPIAVPLAVVNAGNSMMILPFIGAIDFGFFFPLFIIPIGIIGAINGYNMLAGYNGLEAGMGAIILTTLAFIAWLSGSGWVSMISLITVFSILAFMIYNMYPARVFPGDSFTYAIGAMIASVAILGNMEKFAVILFIPYFFDALMYVRFRFIDRAQKVEAYAKINSDGSLDMPNEKVYDFTHLAIKVLKRVKKKVYEKDVVLSVFLFEIALSAVVFLWWLFTESKMI